MKHQWNMDENASVGYTLSDEELVGVHGGITVENGNITVGGLEVVIPEVAGAIVVLPALLGGITVNGSN